MLSSIKRHAVAGAVSLSTALLLTAGTMSAAAADSGSSSGNHTAGRQVDSAAGGGVCTTDCDAAPGVAAQGMAKMSLAQSYYDALYGQGSIQEFNNLALKYEDDFADRLGRADSVESFARVPIGGGGPAKGWVVLKVRHYGQINGHYCGPAAGKMILHAEREGRSAWNHVTQTQNHIGGPAHMRSGDGTQWASHRFRIGLNRWRNGSNYGFYVEKHNPSGSKFRNAVVYDIAHKGLPFGADTVEFKGGRHYNGHPVSQLIGHWVPIIGYHHEGKSTRFADSSTSIWARPKKKFNYNTHRFANRFLNNNGIVW